VDAVHNGGVVVDTPGVDEVDADEDLVVLGVELIELVLVLLSDVNGVVAVVTVVEVVGELGTGEVLALDVDDVVNALVVGIVLLLVLVLIGPVVGRDGELIIDDV
jgi:hypothetical protein